MSLKNSSVKRGSVIIAILLAAILSIPTFTALVQPVKPAEAQAPQLPREERNWERKNHDEFSSNFQPQKQITKDNVQFLELKWIYPIPDSGQARLINPALNKAEVAALEGAETPPLVVDGIVYVMTNYNQISALDAKTGKQIWVYRHAQNVTKDSVGLPISQTPTGYSHTHGINYFDGKIWFYGFGCKVYGVDALTGKVAVELGPICQDVPGNQNDPIDKSGQPAGLFSNNCNPSPPWFYAKKRILLVTCSAVIAHSFVAGYNIDTKQLLWRFFYQPAKYPPEPDYGEKLCAKAQANGGNGWFGGADFSQGKMASGPIEAMRAGGLNRPQQNVYTYKTWSCQEVIAACPTCLKDDWIADSKFSTGSPWAGKFPAGAGVQNPWGESPVDPDTDLFYVSTGQPTPDYNMTLRPGPSLCSDCTIAVNAVTGELKWFFQYWPHDPIDVDCNLNTLFGKVGNQKIVLKTCKSGISYGLDATTGKPLWTFDPYSIPTELVKRPQNFACSAPSDPRSLAALTCLSQFCDPVTGTYENRKANCAFIGHHARYLAESDDAFDGKYFYSSVMSGASYVTRTTNLGGNPQGGIGGGSGQTTVMNWPQVGQGFGPRNSTTYAIDALTGQIKWRWFNNEGHRGGLMVSGGVIYQNDLRARINLLDADTGKLIGTKNIGSPVVSQVTMGADPDGKMKVFVIFGGANHGVWGERGVAGVAMVPGAVLAFGLPDKLPEAQVVTKEVIKEVPKEVVKEVVKEVPKEVVKEVIKEVPKEVIKEVPKEITKTVTVETISPISYAAIGLGVVLVVIAGVIFSRRKKA